jgi:hypothetical protein
MKRSRLNCRDHLPVQNSLSRPVPCWSRCLDISLCVRPAWHRGLTHRGSDDRRRRYIGTVLENLRSQIRPGALSHRRSRRFHRPSRRLQFSRGVVVGSRRGPARPKVPNRRRALFHDQDRTVRELYNSTGSAAERRNRHGRQRKRRAVRLWILCRAAFWIRAFADRVAGRHPVPRGR